jgi:multiple sugar transport system permease protein
MPDANEVPGHDPAELAWEPPSSAGASAQQYRARRRNVRVRRAIGMASRYLGLIVIGGVLMMPFIWMVSSSLKEQWEIFRVPPTLLPVSLRFLNYPEALVDFPFFHALKNTLIITLSAVVGQILSASMAAFAFSRLRFRFREPLFVLVLATLMIPSHVTLVPVYMIFHTLGWLDTFLPLIAPNWLGGGAFNIFLLRQFFLTIPREMDDAARIDGCSTLRLFWNIIMPMSVPALATVGIFGFLANWNDFFGPLIYLSDPAKHTLAIALQFYRTPASTTGPVRSWNHLMAVSVVVMLPCLILFFSAQRTFIQGIVITGVKG